MKPTNHELEAISIRRAKVSDAHKVRYRVYSNASEFVAVIADSALMAVKISGIAKPFKIMRDLPSENSSIEAEHMAEPEEIPERVAFALSPRENPSQFLTEMPTDTSIPAAIFVPIGIGELQRKDGNRLRILPPDMVHEIIERHMREQEPPAAEPPLQEGQDILPEESIPPAPPPPPAEPTVAEKVTQLAQEILPSEADLAPAPAPVPSSETLSPEEVEKLLNG